MTSSAFCPDRREFISRVSGAAAVALLPKLVWSAEETGLVEVIEREVIFPGRESGPTWFHPRPCIVPTEQGRQALMTLQTIGGSDVFGPVHLTTSDDLGKTWSEPQPIPGLGRNSLDNGWEMGVCDVVPEYHARTGTVLAIGHNVYYRNGVLARPQRERWPVYVVRSAEGSWSEPQRLAWDDPRGSEIYTCGCSQRVNLPNGDVLIPISFGPQGRTHRSVASLQCSFDGHKLNVKEVGSELTNTAGRGLLEPSLVSHGDRFYLTIRAEDDRGYVAISADGLHWGEPKPWSWDDGRPLVMSTTQQHWLPHSDALFLVYTRRARKNVNVFRWRAPLYMAQVDPVELNLIRSTERVVLPLIGDGIGRPKHVARMGNFHTVMAAPEESWVTVGETLPEDGWKGDTLLARVRWSRPNRLVARA